jgi:hypothetical protein
MKNDNTDIDEPLNVDDYGDEKSSPAKSSQYNDKAI